MNPIENVWKIIGEKAHNRIPQKWFMGFSERRMGKYHYHLLQEVNWLMWSKMQWDNIMQREIH